MRRIFRIMAKGLAFVENGIEQYQKKQEAKTIKWLEQQSCKTKYETYCC